MFAQEFINLHFDFRFNAPTCLLLLSVRAFEAPLNTSFTTPSSCEIQCLSQFRVLIFQFTNSKKVISTDDVSQHSVPELICVLLDSSFLSPRKICTLDVLNNKKNVIQVNLCDLKMKEKRRRRQRKKYPSHHHKI